MVKINQSTKPVLPEGWQCRTSTRRKGQTRGRVDKHYVAPDGTLCRSLRAVYVHIAAANPDVPDPVAPDPLPTDVTEATPVVVPDTIALDDNGSGVIVVDSSSDEDDDEGIAGRINRYDEERIANKIKIMQDVAKNEQLEGKRAVHAIFIAELQMLLEKTSDEHNTVNDQDHRKRLRVFLKGRIGHWEQSLAKLSRDEVTWNHIAHQNHIPRIHELKSRHLHLQIDAFLASDDESDEDNGE
jgi:hypothetical protein